MKELPRPPTAGLRGETVKIEGKGTINLVIVTKIKNYTRGQMTEDWERKELGLSPLHRDVMRVYASCESPKGGYFWSNKSYDGVNCKVIECTIKEYDVGEMECDRPKKIDRFTAPIWVDRVNFDKLSPDDQKMLSSIRTPYGIGLKSKKIFDSNRGIQN